MSVSTLSLGGFVFDDFSTPRVMTSGGKQALVVHKLPGGARVIDTIGPDERDIAWEGFFFGNDAYAAAMVLDAMRAAGQVLPLVFAGQYRSVILETFEYSIRREPVWVEYHINCTVYQNPALGQLGGAVGGIGQLVISDLAQAIGL